MSKISYYSRFIETGRKGFTLKGGPFAKWRYPLNKVLYKRRLEVGPEPERPRSVWSNWNYDAEVFAFAKRLNEKFNDGLLRQAFVDPSFTASEKIRLKDLGVEYDSDLNNLKLANEGEKICKYYIKALFNFWYPNFPNEGVEAVSNHLLSVENLAYIGRKLGVYDLIKSQEFPLKNETIQSCLFALIAALKESDGAIRAHLFINDFIVTQLNGKNVNEIWHVNNPMGFLCNELEKRGYKSLPKSRLIWSTGKNNPTAAFIVGLYINEQFFSKGSGETIDIAEEMAARDGLRRLFGTTEEAAQLPLGDKARKFSHIINSAYENLIKTDQTR